ncbi:MAG: maleylpyruvate isomerase N-terminal domain-containing protein [Spirochaetia bacterium]|jgi:hypothetical protein
MGTAYSARNKTEREHLQKVVSRLSETQMARPAGGKGWTVSGLLAHIAFWDQRALVLMRRWKAGGTGSPAGDVDVINDAMQPFLLAVPPRKAAELALEAAQAIDREIDALDPEMLARVEANGQPKLDRAGHRAHHLEQIEKAIG